MVSDIIIKWTVTIPSRSWLTERRGLTTETARGENEKAMRGIVRMFWEWVIYLQQCSLHHDLAVDSGSLFWTTARSSSLFREKSWAPVRDTQTLYSAETQIEITTWAKVLHQFQLQIVMCVFYSLIIEAFGPEPPLNLSWRGVIVQWCGCLICFVNYHWAYRCWFTIGQSLQELIIHQKHC